VIVIPETPEQFTASLMRGFRVLRKPFRNSDVLGLLDELRRDAQSVATGDANDQGREPA
jgi:hypothetical protein